MCRACSGNPPGPLSFDDFRIRVLQAIRNVNNPVDFVNEAINHLYHLKLHFVSFRKVVSQVRLQRDLAITHTLKVTKQYDPVSRKLVQVKGVTTIYP